MQYSCNLQKQQQKYIGRYDKILYKIEAIVRKSQFNIYSFCVQVHFVLQLLYNYYTLFSIHLLSFSKCDRYCLFLNLEYINNNMNNRMPRKSQPITKKSIINAQKLQPRIRFMRKSVDNDENIKKFRKARQLLKQEQNPKFNYQNSQLNRIKRHNYQFQLPIHQQKENILAKYINQCQMIESTQVESNSSIKYDSSESSMLETLLYSNQKFEDNQFPRYQNIKQICSTVQSIQSILQLKPSQFYRFDGQVSQTPVRSKKMFLSEAGNKENHQKSQSSNLVYFQSLNKNSLQQEQNDNLACFDDNSILLQGYKTSEKSRQQDPKNQSFRITQPYQHNQKFHIQRKGQIKTNSNSISQESPKQSLLIQFTDYKSKNSLYQYPIFKKQRLSFSNCMNLQISSRTPQINITHSWKPILTIQRQQNNFIVRKTKTPTCFVLKDQSIQRKLLNYLINSKENQINIKSTISILDLFLTLKSMIGSSDPKLQLMKILFQMRIPATLQQIQCFMLQIQRFSSFNRFFEMKFLNQMSSGSWIFYFHQQIMMKSNFLYLIPYHESVQIWNILDKIDNDFKKQLAIWLYDYHLKE